MAKEKQNNKPSKPSETADLFKEPKNKIKQDTIASSRIPSIIEFVYDKKYLGLPFQNPAVIPYDIQELILKCFYRGSPGNENLELTQKDLDIIAKNNLNDPANGALLDKWNSMERFIELVLVWGRRCLSENCEIVDLKTGKLWTLGELWNYGKTNLS